jgi:hypothetical protein
MEAKKSKKNAPITLQREACDKTTSWERKTQDFEVNVGDGATICMYSDRHAATIIEIGENGRYITVQQDDAKRILKPGENAMSDCQDYEYTRNPAAPTYTFYRTRKDKNKYTDNGRANRDGSNGYGSVLWIGVRDEYYDYSF